MLGWLAEPSAGEREGLAPRMKEPKIRFTEIRRLQFAAKQGRTWANLFRPVSASREASAAELRLRLGPLSEDRLNVDIVKRRGGWPLSRNRTALERRADTASPSLGRSARTMATQALRRSLPLTGAPCSGSQHISRCWASRSSGAARPRRAVPAVLVHENRVCQADERALQAGIALGSTLATAHSIAPELVHFPFDTELQTKHLEILAESSYRFSSEVSLAPPDALLIEGSRSLRLFGGQ